MDFPPPPKIEKFEPSNELSRISKLIVIVSVVALCISLFGMVPKEITALGIEFTYSDTNNIKLFVFYVLSFLQLSFILLVVRDGLFWWHQFFSESMGSIVKLRKFAEHLVSEGHTEISDESKMNEHWNRIKDSQHIILRTLSEIVESGENMIIQIGKLQKILVNVTIAHIMLTYIFILVLSSVSLVNLYKSTQF